MKTAVICLLGLVGSWGHAAAESRVEGRVWLDSGTRVAGAQVLLFDLTDLRAPPLAAITDRSGRFTVPLATLAEALPERFHLGANYPNPFNPSTLIPYQLPASTHVRLEVFNILGQRVATLVDREQPAGFHTASWDATDAAGEAVGAGVYLYRLSGHGVRATRSMLLIDGQAGIPLGRGPSTGSAGETAEEIGEQAPVYGLTVSGPGLVPYVDPAFRVEADMAPLDVVVAAPGRASPSAKAASSGGILGDVDNTGSVDFFDALLVALYSQDASVVMPKNGDISLGDVDGDGRVDLSDAWTIAAWLNDPSDPALPSGIGEPVGTAPSLAPDPATVAFLDDGSWHRFTVQAREPVTVLVNPEGTTPRLEITARSGRGNFCPAEADDDIARQEGETLYLSGCSTGEATVELRRESDGTLLQTYTLEVNASPADLVVSVSVLDATLTPGQSFLLTATVRNEGTGPSAATTLRYYRSSNRTISNRDTPVGTDAVGALAAAALGAESVRLTAPSATGTWYYGACVAGVSGESPGNNCSPAVPITVSGPDAPLRDRAALIAFYGSMDGPNWHNNTNWLSHEPIGRWHGITTDSSGRVTRIEFWYNGLKGQLPPRFSDLTALEVLSLPNGGISDLSGLSNLPHLRELELGGNEISDVSPLLELTNLRQLGLWHNTLSRLSVYTHIPILQSRGVDVQHHGYAVSDGDMIVGREPLIYNDNLIVLPAAIGSRTAYTSGFYEHFADAFDFLVLVGIDGKHIDLPGGYFSPVSNDVQGIGLEIYSRSSEYGSAGKLKGIPFFSHVWWFRGIILHEVLHQWAAYGSHPFVSPDSHMAKFSDIFGAFGGHFSTPFEQIVHLGESRFKAERRGWSYTYGPLDLYLAGLIPPEEVPDFWVAVDGEWIDATSGTFSATSIEKYTIYDIIAEYGRRDPPHSSSQREFRAAVILLVAEHDQTVDSKLLESLSADIAWFSFAGTDESDENNFYEATGGRATIMMDGLTQFLRPR